MATLKVPPHSIDTEVSILGSVLLDKNAIISVAETLLPEHFYEDRHRKIYEAILALYENRDPIDAITLIEKLRTQKSLKSVGGAAYLSELVNKVPTASHVEQYARIVRDFSTKRQLMDAASKLFEMSTDESVAADELLDRAETEVFSLSQRHLQKSFIPVKSVLTDSFDRLDELAKSDGTMRGVPTGFRDLDNILAGMQRSNLLILAARPGVGKTTLALNIARSLAINHKRPVGMFSLEMSKEELVDRLLVAQADIDAWKLKSGKNLTEDDFTKLSMAMGELAEAPIFIDDTPAMSILEMRTKARRLQVEHGLDLIIVDYLQLARGRTYDNRVQEVSEISQGLKNLARELRIPVLALSQLSRQVEQRGTKRPQLSDLRESGCVTGDTLVYRSDTGERIRIDMLVGQKNIPVLCVTKDMKLSTSLASRVFPSGKKLIYTMDLKSGKQIRASGNHKFLTVEGWKRLDELSVNTSIATPRNILAEGGLVETLSQSKAILLAHLIGDGCYVKRQPLHYTNADISLIEIVQSAAISEFEVKPRIVAQKDWYHLYLPSIKHLTRGVHNPIATWLQELGIYGQHSWEKHVPNLVFNQKNDIIALFLRHLWSTDGCVFVSKLNKGPHVRIYYASTSKTLSQDVSHLLLRLGIISTLRKSVKEGYRPSWQVHIQGCEQQAIFLKTVGCAGAKEKVVEAALKKVLEVIVNPNNDVIPKDIWKTIKKVMSNQGITTREFHKKMNWAYSGTQRYRNGLSRKRLSEIATALKSQELMSLAQSDIYWDKIVSIDKGKIEKVYDATVPGEANFVANDIIIHNSIEQDADVVMFLWRDDEEKLENIFLDIAKHRNGPVGQIAFHFKGDRISFYGVEHKR